VSRSHERWGEKTRETGLEGCGRWGRENPKGVERSKITPGPWRGFTTRGKGREGEMAVLTTQTKGDQNYKPRVVGLPT